MDHAYIWAEQAVDNTSETDLELAERHFESSARHRGDNGFGEFSGTLSAGDRRARPLRTAPTVDQFISLEKRPRHSLIPRADIIHIPRLALAPSVIVNSCCIGF
jgi:hypothetical protein